MLDGGACEAALPEGWALAGERLGVEGEADGRVDSGHEAERAGVKKHISAGKC